MGQGLLIHEVSWSHTTTHQSVGLLWTSDQLVAETSTWQHSQQTNAHAPGGIRTHNLSRRAAADPRLRLRSDWDRQSTQPSLLNLLILLDGISEENYSSLLTVLCEPASGAFGNWFISISYLKSYDMNETGAAVSEIETEREREREREREGAGGEVCWS